jgi:hypothetical protein
VYAAVRITNTYENELYELIEDYEGEYYNLISEYIKDKNVYLHVHLR